MMNFVTQLIAPLIASIAAYCTSYLAAEELQQYQKQIETASRLLYVATFIAPILFIENLITPIFIAVSYGVIAFSQKNERQMFFMLAPLSLFIAAQNSTAFLITVCLFAVATFMTTTTLLTKYVKKKELKWDNEVLYDLFATFKVFTVLTVVLYSVHLVF
jgi:hypothetical protein